MSFRYPLLLAVAAVVCAALVLAYWWLQRDRTRALDAAGLERTGTAGAGWRRHVPAALFLVAIALLLFGLARPLATVAVPRVSGTVILAMDVSNSMTATDAAPTRLAAAQAAATDFIKAQPSTVDIGVVAFDQGALTTHKPSNDHNQAIAAVNGLHPAGGTSLGQAILAALTTIVGHTVNLPDPNADGPPPDLGYWGSATILVFSDGEDTSGPDAVAAAQLAADAGVHIDTIGFGTVEGTTVTVDGYQVATALDEDLLTQIAQATTGSYHRAGDAEALDSAYKSLDLRITTKPQLVELTGVAVGAAVLLLTIGGILMISWYGRIL
ncbi:MAG TPA: VWA domain-containing protein [Micromonosporaceae bacterium]|nr:VWA domain-containing protein [Micromonosporaceae bacterium]